MAFTVDNLTIKKAATDKAVDSSTRAIESVQTAAAENPIILDFDETLFLRDSTTEYLNSISPRPLGAAYLLAAAVIRPWRWLPARWADKKISRAWVLAALATLLFPWTLLVWRAKAKHLAQAHWNDQLIAAIAQNPNARVVVASSGFSWIVNPLLEHLPSEVAQKVASEAVACRFWQGLADREKGSLDRMTKVLSQPEIARAVLVTAKEQQNTALLSAVKTPCRVQWPEAEFISAMADVYVPLVYSERVKNPGRSHIMKRVIAGHWAFLVIAFSFLSDHFLLNATGLLLLTFSYWCVYEIGYWENDVIGEKYESKPVLSKRFEQYKDRLRLDTPAPWCWAIGLSVPGLVLLEASNFEQTAPAAIEIAAHQWQTLAFNSTLWVCFLIAVRATFWLYNQFNEEARIWIYPFLQTQKLFGFAMLVSTNAVGVVLLLALAVSRWLHYTIYRCGGDRGRFPLNTCCLVLYVLGFSATTLSSLDPVELITWQAGTAFIYCLVRGIKGFHSVHSPISLVSQQSIPPATVPNTEIAAQPAPIIAVSTFQRAVPELGEQELSQTAE
ncbi:MAG: hypothetical protein DCF25_07060 [Leptolyngbya foveolarum]|uniref:Haloacid dehalogenase-like hydrolase n=1 Tax=Leptolyngbya foveolarum TaxID=47253 RepID=A0A2W4ULN0_9CYAN|nr:MAG: hypothetical protein DCF25_07060 [Leptolyngbya foveolarum]